MKTEEIVNIRTFVKDDKTKVIINGKHFLTPKQIESATGVKGQFFALVGSKLSVEYFKTGEQIREGVKCTKDETIIKEFGIELSSKLAQIQMAAACGASMFQN